MHACDYWDLLAVNFYCFFQLMCFVQSSLDPHDPHESQLSLIILLVYLKLVFLPPLPDTHL